MATKFAKALKDALGKKQKPAKPVYVVGLGGAIVIEASSGAEAKKKVQEILAAVARIEGVQTGLCDLSVISATKL